MYSITKAVNSNNALIQTAEALATRMKAAGNEGERKAAAGV